ncbi:hypothetical protein [Runella sp.]|uniref:hypothetical protein n=1 Tax=Runella sp. TaxID=1960881 RepID=UPI003D11F4F1
MFFRTAIRQRIAWMLCTLMLLIQLNNIFFRHAHRLSNGKIITHAHPYIPSGNGPYQPNNHTSGELFLLDAFTNILFVGATAFSFAFLTNAVRAFRPVFCYASTYYSRKRTYCSLRGPPDFRI